MSNIPNWPLLLTQWAPAYTSNGGNPPTAQYVDMGNRVIGSLGWKSGKQYELDTAQAGELSAQLRNNDQALDPTNTGSPYAGHVLPYQPFCVNAQYPATVNLLTGYQAYCHGATTGATVPYTANMLSNTDSTNGSVVAVSGPGQAFQFAVPSGTTAGNFITSFTGFPVAGGGEYSFTATVLNDTSGYTPSVQIAFAWYSAASVSSVATWQYGPSVSLTYNTAYTISASATAPANATGCAVGIVTASAATSAWYCQLWDSQVQTGAATAFVQPGTWYPLFTGWVERWPSKWNTGGQFGTIGATVVDSLALLSQGQLSDPCTEEINYADAAWSFKLDDPSGSSQAAETNGLFPPLNVVSGKYGTGTVAFGTSIAATIPTGTFTAGGADPTVVSITSPSPGVSTPSGASMLSLSESGINGPANPALFTRMIAFRWTGGAYTSSTVATIWSSFDNVALGAGSSIMVQLVGTSTTTGVIDVSIGNSGVTSYPTVYAPSGFNPFDGNWHLVIFGYDYATLQMFGSVDGVMSGYTAVTANITPTGIVHDSLGGWLDATSATLYEFTGDIAYAAEFPSLLTATQVGNIYSAWYDACSGDTSAQRYTRILRYANYTGPTYVGNGCLSSNMGPATDLSGSDALTCLENVVTTENGVHFVSSNGTLTFTGRGYRYANATPAYTFGENQTGGEWPYEDLQLDFDTTHLANDITITQNFTSQNFYAVNAASQAAYFDRTMTRTINSNSTAECVSAAQFMAWYYGNPATRVSSITLNPAAQANLWPVCLALDVNQCIQVNRRPPGGNEISLLLWIESKQWTLSADGSAKLTLQCSPVVSAYFMQFSNFNCQVASTASSGQPTITVNAAADMVNPLASQIGPGTQLVVGWTAGDTTVMTVQSVSGNPNWTTSTITFTTNLPATVNAGSVVTEAIGSSPLNSWPNSMFDDDMFAY